MAGAVIPFKQRLSPASVILYLQFQQKEELNIHRYHLFTGTNHGLHSTASALKIIFKPGL
jgi:hypothetical protein